MNSKHCSIGKRNKASLVMERMDSNLTDSPRINDESTTTDCFTQTEMDCLPKDFLKSKQSYYDTMSIDRSQANHSMKHEGYSRDKLENLEDIDHFSVDDVLKTSNSTLFSSVFITSKDGVIPRP